MNKSFLIVVIASVLVVGCNSRYVRGITADQKKVAANFPVLETSTAGTNYLEVAKELKGESCRITADDSSEISEQDALLELKYEAYKAGADTLANVHCEKTGDNASSGYASSCLAAWVCIGDGYRQK